MFKPLAIAPNPVESKLRFNIDDLSHGVEISIIDVSGKTVVNINRFSNKSIDVKDLKPGIYFLCIKNNGQKYSGKFIKN